ncbi:hypothetical protein SAY86_009954 [Trapa natans]|uniref:Uncharacterized protein n=1 Tax=Trapa natans TaxID=22666 RepID=A0AAN7L0J6_TRANT|nr:hypothetical protein SAY86_009954 [Trapa natans]
MGRAPCRDQSGLKKGPWTPEEDLTLVAYIQQHGPGNWRFVPTNTAIASYLPQRTDNDIKNYWNSRLKKKLRKLGHDLDGQADDGDEPRGGSKANISRGQWERRLQTDIHTAKQALYDALSVDPEPVHCFNRFDHKPLLLHQGSTIDNYASRNTDHHDSDMLSRSFSSNSDTSLSESQETTNNLSHGYQTSLSFQAGSRQAPSGYTYTAEDDLSMKLLEKWLLDDGGILAAPYLDCGLHATLDGFL